MQFCSICGRVLTEDKGYKNFYTLSVLCLYAEAWRNYLQSNSNQEYVSLILIEICWVEVNKIALSKTSALAILATGVQW
jgi:hypothetical protein